MAFKDKEAWEKVDSNWRSGVEYIHSQLVKTLEENGAIAFDVCALPHLKENGDSPIDWAMGEVPIMLHFMENRDDPIVQ